MMEALFSFYGTLCKHTEIPKETGQHRADTKHDIILSKMSDFWEMWWPVFPKTHKIIIDTVDVGVVLSSYLMYLLLLQPECCLAGHESWSRRDGQQWGKWKQRHREIQSRIFQFLYPESKSAWWSHRGQRRQNGGGNLETMLTKEQGKAKKERMEAL